MEAMLQTPLKGDNFGIDRINELTDDLLCHILSFMTVKDAAKTSILSMRWRYLWAFRSNFSFDLPTLLGSNLPVWRYLPEDKDIMQLEMCRFIQRMDHILNLYRGSKIESFEIAFLLSQESARHVDRWISFAVKEGVEKLVLKFFLGRYIMGNFTFDPSKNYVFPWWILSQENGTHLKHLHIEQCFLRPPPIFHGFHSLITLQLDDVDLMESDVENLLANASNLEKWTMVRCSLPSHFRVIEHFMKLKFLGIFMCRDFEKMVLSSASVESFEYFGFDISRITFMNVPCLVKAYIDGPYSESIVHVLTQLPEDIPSLETMIIKMDYKKAQLLPTNITTFSSLKYLEVKMRATDKIDLLWIIPILNATPLLQKLHLLLIPEEYYNDKRKEKNNHVYHHHQHLQVVEISGFTPNRSQIEFAKYVLSYAVALDKLVINPKARILCGDEWIDFPPLVPWTEYERSMLFQKLQRTYSSVNIVVM